jgi:hypothetical protein
LVAPPGTLVAASGGRSPRPGTLLAPTSAVPRARFEAVCASGSPPPDELKPAADPVVEAYKRHIDRTLLRENLKRSVEERIENLMRLQRFAQDVKHAGLSRR